jgi:hypothetical protein
MSVKSSNIESSKITLKVLKTEKVNMNINTSSENNGDNTKYMPSIYNDLSVFLNKTPDAKILNCEDKNQILVETKSGENECVDWDSPEAKKAMLKNIKSKRIYPEHIIAPKQLQANCWFNCFFMVFFISDKGRFFFRYLRESMVKGVIYRSGGKPIPENIRKALFFLNSYIEASINGTRDISKFAEVMDTNFLIYEIAKAMPLRAKYKYAIGRASNPIEFYKSIINYLGDNNTRILIENKFIDNSIFASIEEKPHIIVIERNIESKISSFFNDSNNNNNNNNSKIADTHIPLTLNFTDHTYKLDSIIQRDIGREHFAAFITLNKKQYAFDGNQYSRLQKMNWKDMLNTIDQYVVWDVDGETPQEEIENTHFFSFQQGYQQLFYYRVE